MGITDARGRVDLISVDQSAITDAYRTALTDQSDSLPTCRVVMCTADVDKRSLGSDSICSSLPYSEVKMAWSSQR